MQTRAPASDEVTSYGSNNNNNNIQPATKKGPADGASEGWG